ncbi:MAG TPA: sensor domain-containing diguanylate cyclase [Firmicutes bacterium]|nr:sensor domain-containing diguanylate cyclase [Bacillota bacterium]
MATSAAGHEAYKWAIGISGLLLLVFLSWGRAGANWAVLLLFALMAVLAEYLDVRMPNGIRISVTFAAVLPCFLLEGTLAAGWVNVLSSFFGNALPRRRPISVAIFNGGQYALSCLIAGGAYHLAGGHVGVSGFLGGADWFPLGVLVVSYFLVNHVLVTTYVVWREAGAIRRLPHRLQEIAGESLRWDVLNYLVTIPLALAMVQTLRGAGPGATLLLFAPMVAVGYVLRLHMELRGAMKRLTVINEVAEQLNSSLDQQRILQTLSDAVTRLVHCDVCAIYLREGDGGAATWTEAGPGRLRLAHLVHPYPSAFSLGCICPGEGEIGQALSRGRVTLVQDAVGAGWVTPDPEDPAPPRGAAVVPLARDGGLVGMVWVSSRRAGGCSADEVQALEILGSQAAVALQNASLYRRAEELAVTDDLTGLYNHRHFTSQLQTWLARCRRTGEPLALIYVDLDDMSQYNNNLGHVLGDDLLREFGQTLKSVVRETDVPTRYGGDEFAVILARAGREEALMVAERIREKLESHHFHGPSGALTITASIGVAMFPEDAQEATDLVRVADQAMYRAKSAGGNQVLSAGPPASDPPPAEGLAPGDNLPAAYEAGVAQQ